MTERDEVDEMTDNFEVDVYDPESWDEEDEDGDRCPECDGTGKCQDCDGEGCPECDGTGKCWECDGTGTV